MWDIDEQEDGEDCPGSIPQCINTQNHHYCDKGQQRDAKLRWQLTIGSSEEQYVSPITYHKQRNTFKVVSRSHRGAEPKGTLTAI